MGLHLLSVYCLGVVRTLRGRPGFQEVGLDVLAPPVEPVLRLSLEDGVLGRTPKTRVSTPHPLPLCSATKPRRLPQNPGLTLILFCLCGKLSHSSKKDGPVSLWDGLFVMQLIIVLLRFQILENHISIGSKGQTFYNNLFLRLDSLGVRLVLEILSSGLVFLCEK